MVQDCLEESYSRRQSPVHDVTSMNPDKAGDVDDEKRPQDSSRSKGGEQNRAFARSWSLKNALVPGHACLVAGTKESSMTNVRTNSLDAKMELDRYLEEAEAGDLAGMVGRNAEDDQLRAARSKIAELRNQVSDLRIKLAAIGADREASRRTPMVLPLVGLALATVLLGTVVERSGMFRQRRFSLGASRCMR